jgi:UDP-N-acetylglucosamine:LPS N-acetylglucosamine transferase
MLSGMQVDDAVRVLVLTAPIGEGHLAAARTLAEDIRRRDPQADVVVCDVLEEFNRPLRWLLCDAYRWQLGTAPWLFGTVFGGLRRSRVLRSMSRVLLSLTGSRAVLRVVRAQRPDVIVSTFPATTAILGCLRLRGRVQAPVCATITDFAGLEMWIDRGVDLHLVMHQSLLPTVERVAGPGSARVVSPLVSARFLVPKAPSEARRTLGLPLADRLIVVSGGGWAVGDLAGAVVAALELADVFVVCLAGRDPATRERLELAFGADPRVTVLGFTDRMSDLLAAADILVHSTGGVTCLEALASGCPIVAYGAPPGHAPLLAREMAALGLLVHARSAAELRAALGAGTAPAPATLTHADDAAGIVLAARARVRARKRARAARPLALAAAMAVLVLAVFSSDLTYPLVAEAFALPETRSIVPPHDAVALVVRGDRASLLAFAPIARRHHLHGSVVTSEPLTSGQVARLRSGGLDPIPEITVEGIRSSLSAERHLRAQVLEYGMGRSFYYVAPQNGFTIAAYLLAHHLGGIPLQGSAVLTSANGADLQSGAIVTATLEPGAAAAARLLRSWERLARTGPAISSVQLLTARSA